MTEAGEPIVHRAVARFRPGEPLRHPRSVPRFALMPYREDRDTRLVDPVHHPISAIAKIDQPFAKNRVEFVDRAPEARLLNQDIDAGSNRLDRATRGGRILIGEKTMKTDNRLLCGSSPDQS